MNITQLHDGRLFPSISAAARALDIDHKTLIYHLDTHGHTGKAGKQCRKCEVNGVEYPSITAACKATGFTRDKINWMRGYRKPNKES